MRRQNGYSLIELLVAVAILGVILAGVFYSFGV
jgi:prepilin-type N-terminal cleavage/methylation domain-containing protein